jgi:hypothetical protein
MVRSTHIQVLHGFDVFPGCSVCLVIGVVQFVSVEVSAKVRTERCTNLVDVLCSWIPTISSSVGLNSSYELGFDLPIANSFHHGKVFKIIMSLEQGIPSEELNENASNAPNITREAPSKIEDYLWSTVMAC